MFFVAAQAALPVYYLAGATGFTNPWYGYPHGLCFTRLVDYHDVYA